MKHAGNRFVLGLFLVMTCWPGSWGQAHARSLDDIRQSGELRACVASISPAYARFESDDCRHCAASGAVPRVVAAFARSLGNVRPVFHRLEWDEQFHDANGKTVREAAYTPQHLESGRCDMYPTHLTKNEWRSTKLDFATLFPSRMMVIVRQERLSGFSTEADLAGKTAAVALNTSHHTWVLEHNQGVFRDHPIQIRLIPSGSESVTVASGDADFTLLDAEVSLWESVHRFQNMSVAFPVGSVEEIGWGFRKRDTDLRDAARAFFEKQVNDETSELNAIWKEEYGLSVNQLRLLIRATQ